MTKLKDKGSSFGKSTPKYNKVALVAIIRAILIRLCQNY